MPDASFDWDAAEAEARLKMLGNWPPSARATVGKGWDAAMAWVKRTALAKMLGAYDTRIRCDHQHQETNLETGRTYCLECNATIAVRSPEKPPLDVVCSRCAAGRGAPCVTPSGKPSHPHKVRRERSSTLRATVSLKERAARKEAARGG